MALRNHILVLLIAVPLLGQNLQCHGQPAILRRSITCKDGLMKSIAGFFKGVSIRMPSRSTFPRIGFPATASLRAPVKTASEVSTVRKPITPVVAATGMVKAGAEQQRVQIGMTQPEVGLRTSALSQSNRVTQPDAGLRTSALSQSKQVTQPDVDLRISASLESNLVKQSGPANGVMVLTSGVMSQPESNPHPRYDYVITAIRMPVPFARIKEGQKIQTWGEAQNAIRKAVRTAGMGEAITSGLYTHSEYPGQTFVMKTVKIPVARSKSK